MSGGQTSAGEDFRQPRVFANFTTYKTGHLLHSVHLNRGEVVCKKKGIQRKEETEYTKGKQNKYINKQPQIHGNA